MPFNPRQAIREQDIQIDRLFRKFEVRTQLLENTLRES